MSSLKINRVSKVKLRGIIELSFEGDTDLIEKYHSVGISKDASIDETMKRIDDISKMQKCSFFDVRFCGKSIGYFVIFDKFLFSFCINIRYRKKDILLEWWGEVKKQLGEEFGTMLFNKNEPAIEFLKRQGMKVFKKDTETTILISK